MEDPDAPKGGPSAFVDRVPEVKALSDALLTHRARMDAGLIDTTELRNVLTFYGEGGAGKSELSRQLQDWVSGQAALEHWPTPDRPADVTARWDFNDSFGVVDPHPLLVALRAQLGAFRGSWPAFDLAFAAFHQAVKPGTELRFRTPRGDTTFSDLVMGLVGDALTVGGMAVTGGASAGIVGVGRHLLTKIKRDSEIGRALRKFPQLEQLVKDAEALQQDREKIAEVAARLIFMLNLEIEAMDPRERPTVVVFADHMERLQVAGSRHLGEGVLNRMVSRSPWLLFVVTGRNSLRWHEVSDLPVSGPARWPLLSTEDPPVDEPRQHAIGFLSRSDAVEFLATSFERMGVAVADGIIEELAESTDGWPLHLQTILVVAEGRASGGPLSVDDLGGSFPAIVDRLLSDLPHEVANAFRAACLLPYFDVEFVVAAGQVSAGAVEQLLRRQLVRPNDGSVYPYRIHDTLRALVREAGSQASGGWGAADWARHTQLALDEAQRRFDDAVRIGEDGALLDVEDDVAAIESLALGLNVATENNTFDPWLIHGIRRSPTIQGLAPRISASVGDSAPTDLVDTMEFLALRARPRSEDVTAELLAIADRHTAISSGAGLWRAYDLRANGRVDEALQQLETLISEFGDRVSLYRNQIATTMRLDRRFRDAHAVLPLLTDEQQKDHHNTIGRWHGHFEGAADAFEPRVVGAKSRRFQVEMEGTWLVLAHRERGVSNRRARTMLDTALRVGHRTAQALALGVLAEINLFDAAGFTEAVEGLEHLSQIRGRPYRSWVEALALRAWSLSDEDLAQQAQVLADRLDYRSASWIPTEILLEDLGHPLGPVSTQWLEPYEDVSRRWLAIFDQVVHRARGE